MIHWLSTKPVQGLVGAEIGTVNEHVLEPKVTVNTEFPAAIAVPEPVKVTCCKPVDVKVPVPENSKPLTEFVEIE